MIIKFEDYRHKKETISGDHGMPIHGYVREVLYSCDYGRLKQETDSSRRLLARIVNSADNEVRTKRDKYGYTEEQIVRNELLLLQAAISPLEIERKEFLEKLKKSYERAAKRFNLTVSQVVYNYTGLEILEERYDDDDYESVCKFETAAANLNKKRFSKWSVHEDIADWVRELEQAS